MAGGRPRTFESPDTMQAMCIEYFARCDGRVFLRESSDKDGNPTTKEISNPEPYTILGLCQHLGITRQTLFDYESREEFSDIVKVCKEKVAYDLTLRSIERKDQVAGCLFQLKANHGHKETSVQEIEATVTSETYEEKLARLKGGE